ncbi:VPS8 isoform 18, partial [Pan troglodytes]
LHGSVMRHSLLKGISAQIVSAAVESNSYLLEWEPPVEDYISMTFSEFNPYDKVDAGLPTAI